MHLSLTRVTCHATSMVRKPPRRRNPPGTRYLTPAGYKAFKDEFHELLYVVRPKVVEQVADAAAMGDRSENAEYIYGKKKLRHIDSRLHFLEQRLSDVVVVDPSEQTAADIRFGATVVLEDEELEGEVVYILVGEDEIDPSRNRISWQSPVGRALIGKATDDLVIVNTPKGRRELVVLRFYYDPI